MSQLVFRIFFFMHILITFISSSANNGLVLSTAGTKSIYHPCRSFPSEFNEQIKNDIQMPLKVNL
jgi:hypothetical protein